MNQELPPGMEDDEIQELAGVVAQGLMEGKDPAAMAQQLVDSGWDPDQAGQFVGSIQLQLSQAQRQHDSGGGEGMGWLVWIGGILVINLLSWIFGWGFFIY